MNLNYVLQLFTACLVTSMAIPAIIRFADQVGLYAFTSDRMSHKDATPNLGGVAIFLGVFTSTLLITKNEHFGELQYLLLSQVIVFFLGLKDDIFVLSPSKKLVIQAVCGVIIMSFAEIRIDNFYGILGIGELGTSESFVFTLLVVVGLINAFNLIDGVNWLAGLIALSATSFLAWWFAANGFGPQAGVCFAIIGSTLGFLYFNKTPAKIFMGDAGSLFLGLTITYLILDFITLNHSNTNLSFQLRSAPTIAISVMFIPILDTIRVFFIRIKNGKSPFKPDRNHLHHILLDSNFSHIQSSLILFTLNSVAIIASIVLNQYTGRIVIPFLFLAGFTILNLISFNRIKKSHRGKLKTVA